MVQNGQPLVLIADDDVHTTLMLERIFEREGYSVRSVNNGIAALEASQSLLPDLILLDIQMPGMSGFDVLRLLRENPATVSIPTIVITARAREPDDVAYGLNLGADDYIPKPFNPRELLARANSKIKARRLEETIHRRTQELEALLRVSEELNQYLEVNELLDLVLFLALDLLPGDIAAIYQFDEQRQVIEYHVETKRGIDTYAATKKDAIDRETPVRRFLPGDRAVMWPPNPPLSNDFASGMAVPLQHGDAILGMLMLVAQDVQYDESHLRLFEGIGRQAALALRNAELYEIQAKYALHLEDMVAERTAELRSAQEMLVRSEKLASIGHLAASIAHEINNPLQPIRINLEHLMEDIQTAMPVDIQAVASIQESVERIRRIVSQLLEFTGKRNTDADVESLDVSRILEGIIRLNRKFFEQEGMTIEAALASLPPVHGNKDQLEQVFMNMVLNAKAAMERGGRLQITTRAENDSVMIEFSDTGSGIAPEVIHKIFDPFFSTRPGGTGLGLFVSYGIVQSHNGTIEVDSKLGGGTTFRVRLPASTNP